MEEIWEVEENLSSPMRPNDRAIIVDKSIVTSPSKTPEIQSDLRLLPGIKGPF